jgi:hypothetical protein
LIQSARPRQAIAPFTFAHKTGRGQEIKWEVPMKLHCAEFASYYFAGVTTGTATFLILADGMGEPGLDIPTPIIVLVWGAIIALITGVSRRCGASKKLAVCVPCVPLGLVLVCSIPHLIIGQGGAGPMGVITGPAFGIALVASLIAAFVVKSKKTQKPDDV